MKKYILLSLFTISLIVLLAKFALLILPGVGEKAGLRVSSMPEGAKVFVNEKEVGQTPYENTTLTNKEYTIRVSENEAQWQGKVKLNFGTMTIINREISKNTTMAIGEVLSLEKGKGVTVLSSPNTADIEIEGKYYGKTPLHLDVEPKEYTFLISKQGFLKRSIKATVPENYRLILNVDLSISELDLTNISTQAITETPKLIVKNTPTGFLRVRDKASLSGKEIAQVSPGDELVLLEELPSWDRVRLSDGKEGYVFVSYVEKKKSN